MSSETATKAYEEALRQIEICRKKGIKGTHLALRNLGLQQLPPEIGTLSALKSLNLASNDLMQLPMEIGHLSALEYLNVCINELKELPREIARLGALKSLDLSFNPISQLPPELWQLTTLQLLALRFNHLPRLPHEIGQLSALTSLSFSANKFSELPSELWSLSGLESLDLSFNDLTRLPSEIGQLSALMSLDLRSNNLTQLPRELWQLAALRRLCLQSNRLEQIQLEISTLQELDYLDLRSNRLKVLPDHFKIPPKIKRLLIWGNPFPEELLNLSGGRNGVGTKLIRYLRVISEIEERHNSLTVIGSNPGLMHFNEAKLLLVGPGNVGKTWLLQALQGRIPRPVGSTKGIEIAREPLEVVHPSDQKRKLRLTCWDFGGQEHLQVTHQIFFSSKAIYLLVWKPREGFDPEMEARLERIQLSAGPSARVLIVSTHADGKIPAILGQDALRQRFGALIGGFFIVDSCKGPDGTGIPELKIEIARVAAQLDGMDLAFPTSWHSAQKAILRLQTPAISFKQLTEIFAKNRLNLEATEILAQLMEVQGHIVYFPDAATDDDAGAPGEENIIVLQPEWLAKAVGFVVEDEATISSQGILKHGDLARIWALDKRRDCPGYDPKLFGFLLWLMWKYHIAYKQDGYTSLIPELIARNRPDGLLWKPDSKSRGPEVRAMCLFASEISGKVISVPKGVVPALTAAVHPLRQLRVADDPDKLDRNWNTGFFLHTQFRGDAFVELRDRELLVVVRHEYPALLLSQILQTLEGFVPKRWPHVRLDLCIPCLGRSGGACPGLFRKDWLERQHHETVQCQHCGRDDIDPSDLLEGFDPKLEEVMERLRQLREGQQAMLKEQQDLLAAAHAIFLALDPENDERRRAPSLFTILPETANWRDIGFDKFRVTCWCEHPNGPHPASPIGSNGPGDFVLKTPKDWLARAAPYMSWAVSLLKAFTPLAGNVASQTTGAFTQIDLKDAVTLMKDCASAFPTGKVDVGDQMVFDQQLSIRGQSPYKLSYVPELTALRHIHDLLEEQIKKPKRWGDLIPVRSNSGDLLWLCPEHAAIQSPPLQDLDRQDVQ